MSDLRSALASYAVVAGQPAAASGPQLQITEIRGWQLAHLTSWRNSRAAFRWTLGEQLQAPPPEALCRGVTQGPSRLVRLTPDQYWWVTGDAAAFQRLQSAVTPALGAFTALSDARVRIGLTGSAALELLSGVIALDLHPAAFVVGQSAQTGLHHTGVLLERVAEESYELFIPRTFAATIWEFLLDAALPLGVKPA
jgi:sarcosine oxidase subunit gamma